jgi:ATP phosphoribosyltransferase
MEPQPERLAIPKKGRVYEQVLNLMLDCGLKIRREGRLDFCVCKNLGIEVYFLPAKDIPGAVASGAIHMGVTGIDLIRNANADVDQHLELGVGKARMVLASPESSSWDGPQSLNGQRIGSSYTGVAKQYLEANNVTPATLVHFDGSVEVQVALGVVDAIVEITETGSSLKANRLAIREEILESEMVFIGTKGYQSETLDVIVKRMRRVQKGRSHVMLKFNLPTERLEDAYQLSKGMSSPTVNHLADQKWVAIEVAVARKEVHHLMDRLDEMGAKGILSHELSLCVPN